MTSEWERYDIPDENVAACRDTYIAALTEIGIRIRAGHEPHTVRCKDPLPDDVHLRAVNIAQRSVGLPEFPDMNTLLTYRQQEDTP